LASVVSTAGRLNQPKILLMMDVSAGATGTTATGFGVWSTMGAGCDGVMPLTAASGRGAAGSVCADGMPKSVFSGRATIS
jgi:hypothetical protein